MIASYSSNVAILVHDLMLARGIARQTSVHAIDVQGRVYCGCGASICMDLERRLAQQPSRPFDDVLNDESFIRASVAVTAADEAPAGGAARGARPATQHALLPAPLQSES